MTEQEWLASSEPWLMLNFLKGKTSNRKLRLFACACCRQVYHLLTDDRSRRAVEITERYAEGSATKLALKAARKAAFRVRENWPREIGPNHRWGPSYAEEAAYRVTLGPHEAAREAAGQAAMAYAYGMDGVEQDQRFQADRSQQRLIQAGMMRCIFGPLALCPIAIVTWQTTTTMELAQAIFANRTFDRLSILADALEDAGCTDPNVLGHCRGSGPHACGCWVVDRLLGKE